jgi:hypothetical protein
MDAVVAITLLRKDASCAGASEVLPFHIDSRVVVGWCLGARGRAQALRLWGRYVRVRVRVRGGQGEVGGFARGARWAEA